MNVSNGQTLRLRNGPYIWDVSCWASGEGDKGDTEEKLESTGKFSTADTGALQERIFWKFC